MFSYIRVCPGASVSSKDAGAGLDWFPFRNWNVNVCGADVRFVAQTVV
jgi:hypothetical protein